MAGSAEVCHTVVNLVNSLWFLVVCLGPCPAVLLTFFSWFDMAVLAFSSMPFFLYKAVFKLGLNAFHMNMRTM